MIVWGQGGLRFAGHRWRGTWRSRREDRAMALVMRSAPWRPRGARAIATPGSSLYQIDAQVSVRKDAGRGVSTTALWRRHLCRLVLRTGALVSRRRS